MESVFFFLAHFFLRPIVLFHHMFFLTHFFRSWRKLEVCIHVASPAVLRRSDDVRSRTRSSRCTSSPATTSSTNNMGAFG